jgi:pimeloyl-ACP methyl ester carboxylesterase
MEPAELKLTEVAGRRLAWRSTGQGAPLLLVNGYAASRLDWDRALLASLGRSFTVISPDNRGIGESELGDPAELTVSGMADDLVTLLDALGLARVPVAGWSMGGFVAQALTAAHPDRVETLVLLSTDPGGTPAVTGSPEAWAALTDHSGAPREQASRLIALLFPPTLAPQIDREFGELVAAARAGLRPETLAAQEAAIDAWHATEPPSLPRQTPPVLAAAGALDAVVPHENLKRLAARWPGAKVELFEGGGHAFMAQEPERLVSLIAEFTAAAVRSSRG